LFELYDDEGLTYGYENGEYWKTIKNQHIDVWLFLHDAFGYFVEY